MEERVKILSVINMAAPKKIIATTIMKLFAFINMPMKTVTILMNHVKYDVTNCLSTEMYSERFRQRTWPKLWVNVTNLPILSFSFCSRPGNHFAEGVEQDQTINAFLSYSVLSVTDFCQQKQPRIFMILRGKTFENIVR